MALNIPRREGILKRLLIVTVSVAVLLGACSQGNKAKEVHSPGNTSMLKSQNEGNGKILARVGNDIIYEKDIDMLLSHIPKQYRDKYSTPRAKMEIVSNLVDVKLLAWEARQEGLDKKPDFQLRMKYFEDQMLAKELENKVAEDIKVTDADIQKYYNEHKDRFATGPRVRVRQILVKTRPEAEKLLQRIKNGEDFASLAKKYSKGPSSQRGGDIGWITKGNNKNLSLFEKAAFSLNKGAVSGIVKTSMGYHIMKVEDKKPAETRTLKEVQDPIKRMIQMEKEGKLISDLKAEVSKKVRVEINKDYFKPEAKESKKSNK